MSGNDHGDYNSPEDPWNKKRNKAPNLDDIIDKIITKLRNSFSSDSNSNDPNQDSSNAPWAFIFTAAAIAGIWALSGFYIVNPAEKAVVLRFGKFVEVTSPGLHWIAPIIEDKYLVDVQKIYSFSLDGDFLTKSSDQNDTPASAIEVTPADVNTSINDQSKNLVNVELNVQYRVNEPQAYLFNIVNPNETVQQVAAGSLSSAIGQMKLDDVLTTGREFLSSKVFEASKKILSSYNAGIEVVAVTLRKAQAPDQVRAAFNDVNRADQDKATYIQQAQAYASKSIPLAQGMAARTLADANGYQQKVVLTAQANIAKYQALLNVYTTSPEITRERMYLETMQSIFSRTTKILLDYNAGNNLLYLPLDKILKSHESNTNNVITAANPPAQTISPNPYLASPMTTTEVNNENN